MDFPILYAKDKNEKIKEWFINVKLEPDNTAKITVSHGYINGKKTEATTHVKVGKNIGKKNETSPLTQAISEATSKFNDKKTKQNYRESVDDLNNIDNIVLKPMLAHDYHKHSNKVKSWRNIYIQPKLDGFRALYNTTTKRATTRQGKPFKNLPQQLLDELGSLPENLVIDGELYTDSLEFEELAVLNSKTLSDTEKLDKIDYYIYDIVDKNLTFTERNNIIDDLLLYKNYTKLKRVETYKVKDFEKELVDYHTKFLENGREGTMIRNGDGKYLENFRSTDLLKYKDSQDSEFEIVGFSFEEDTRSNNKLVKWRVLIKDSITCDIRPKGTVDERIKLYQMCLENFEQFRGRKLWVKYFSYTTDGNLRFPTTLRNTYTAYIRDVVF